MTLSRKPFTPIGLAQRLALGGLVFAGAASMAQAQTFPVGKLFFQLNDTDEDLGIHALVDGDPWKRLLFKDANGRRILAVDLRGRLRQQGLTEFKFESAEPSFDEFTAEEFFARFPDGDYTIEGITLAGQKLQNVVAITHVMPAPPEDLNINDIPTPTDCDDEPIPVIAGPFDIGWSEVTGSHPDLGAVGAIDVVKYEVDVEREDPELKLSFVLSGDETFVQIPDGLLEPGDEIKYQVLVGDAAGNETSSESCFIVQ